VFSLLFQWGRTSSSYICSRSLQHTPGLPHRFDERAKGQVGFMWTFAQSAKAVNPPGTKALAVAVRFSCSGPK
jgi:hypothetical protein